MATIVFAHGAIVGRCCWHWVAPELRAAGHKAHTPTLTGLGDRVYLAGPVVALETHVEDIVIVLRFEDLTSVVLVDWSYGGMIVAWVADRTPDGIGHVVYLDSDIPRDGDMSVPPGQHAAREAVAYEHGDGWPVPPEATKAGAATGPAAGPAACVDQDTPGAAPAQDVDRADQADRHGICDTDDLHPLHGRLRPDR